MENFKIIEHESRVLEYENNYVVEIDDEKYLIEVTEGYAKTAAYIEYLIWDKELNYWKPAENKPVFWKQIARKINDLYGVQYRRIQSQYTFTKEEMGNHLKELNKLNLF